MPVFVVRVPQGASDLRARPGAGRDRPGRDLHRSHRGQSRGRRCRLRGRLRAGKAQPARYLQGTLQGTEGRADSLGIQRFRLPALRSRDAGSTEAVGSGVRPSTSALSPFRSPVIATRSCASAAALYAESQRGKYWEMADALTGSHSVSAPTRTRKATRPSWCGWSRRSGSIRRACEPPSRPTAPSSRRSRTSRCLGISLLIQVHAELSPRGSLARRYSPDQDRSSRSRRAGEPRQEVNPRRIARARHICTFARMHAPRRICYTHASSAP